MKLKNKILLILIFALLVLCFFNIDNVFASCTFTDITGTERTIPDFPSGYISSNGYVIDSDNVLYVYRNPNVFVYCSPYDYHTVSGSIYEFVIDSNTNQYVFSRSRLNCNIYNLIYFSVGFRGDNAGNGLYNVMGDFFSLPVQGVTIPALETAEQIPQSMSQVLKLIIPIGLVILSAILVISLVRLVILRLI